MGSASITSVSGSSAMDDRVEGEGGERASRMADGGRHEDDTRREHAFPAGGGGPLENRAFFFSFQRRSLRVRGGQVRCIVSEPGRGKGGEFARVGRPRCRARKLFAVWETGSVAATGIKLDAPALGHRAGKQGKHGDE